ncbi:MAG: hypothetical protein K9I94_15020 [Bacteroidales bacterium]|nr:hypothetical protein [Bacteroidales bacterium]
MISGNELLAYFEKVLMASANQLLTLLGTFILLGLMLYVISRSLRIIFLKTLGHNSQIYITGWIGVPIHELGHILFCLLFGHKINKIYLFRPEKGSGTLGQVIHQYNSNNVYHRLGNFFIGIGPLITGALALFAALHLLSNYPDIKMQLFSFEAQPAFNNGAAVFNWFKEMVLHGYHILLKLVAIQNIGHVTFWIFIYLIVAIVSHMHLSPSDLKVSWSGLKIIILLVIMINLLLIAIGIDITAYLSSSNMVSGFINTLMVFANMMAIVAFIFFYTLFNLLHLMIRQRWLNPFTTN